MSLCVCLEKNNSMYRNCYKQYEQCNCIFKYYKKEERKMYIKPTMVIINLADDEALVAMARCNGGAYTANSSACS